MIEGKVTDREARIYLNVRGPAEREIQIEAVIDTGYTAALTLPPSQIAALA